MHIGLYLDEPLENARFENLTKFLLSSGLAADGGTFHLNGPARLSELPPHERFHASAEPAELELEIAFLSDEPARNAALAKNHHLPKLLVGPAGLPSRPSQVYVPFENRRFASRWLRPVLETTHAYQWPTLLVYCDQSFVSKEIIKLAKWFRVDSVQQAMANWANEDAVQALGRLIADFPDVEVEAGVGDWQKTLASTEGPLFLMGHLGSGYHLPGRHHGIHYAKLLTACGGSGYFLAD